MTASSIGWLRVADPGDFAAGDRLVVSADDRPVLLLRQDGAYFAIDNRCPHMGFPLERGSVRDCVLTCHWHHARFDLATGGTFDQFADDVRSYPVEVRTDGIWIDLAAGTDQRGKQVRRLQDGIERNIRLVIAKSAIHLLEGTGDIREPFRAGLGFGTRFRAAGWGQGLTMLTCLANLIPYLDDDDRPRALYQGLAAVAAESEGTPARFPIDPLPGATPDLPRLKRLLRQFLEVHDEEGAERAVATVVRAGATSAELTDVLFSAITDHRYIQIGHPADFANKALEALDLAGWEYAEQTATSLVRGIARAARMEESSAWRYPIDLVAIAEAAFEQLPGAMEAGAKRRMSRRKWTGRVNLAEALHSDSPRDNVEGVVDAIRQGATADQVAQAVAYAAALRIARFHTANEFGDWDTVLHTFTFANAVHQAIRRLTGADGDRATPDASAQGRALPLLRGVIDAALSVYLDRFLNTPPARLPSLRPAGATQDDATAILAGMLPLLDQQQRVAEAGDLIARYLAAGGKGHGVLSMLGKGLLREDRDFHTIQTLEAAASQHRLLEGTPEGAHNLIAAGRYLAAHAPTARAQEQTYLIADRLHRGEKLHEV